MTNTHPKKGTIEFMGKRIDGLDTDKIVRMGITLVPEGREVFEELSVRENLSMGAYTRSDKKSIDDDFDRVVTLHTVMNVEEKHTLMLEIRRVLKPAGGFLVYEVCGEENNILHYPVPWADGPKISFLTNADTLRSQITAAGFTEVHWTEVTPKVLDWFDGMAAGMKNIIPERMGPNVGVVLGPNAAEKSRNLQRNLREGLIRVVEGYFKI